MPRHVLTPDHTLRSLATRKAKYEARLNMVCEAARNGWSFQAAQARTGLTDGGLKGLLYRTYGSTLWSTVIEKEQGQ